MIRRSRQANVADKFDFVSKTRNERMIERGIFASIKKRMQF
jgi:hypothetical protein